MTKSKISRKHHYVPQFYLRGFLDDNGHFFLLDKITGKISKTNTRDVFFEKDRNTTTGPKGEKSDWMEKIYSNVENDVAPVFDRIITQKHNVELSHRDKLLLSLHVATLYWRLPTSDNISDEIRNEKGFDSVPFDLFHRDGTTADSAERKKILSDENMRRAYRLLLTFTPFSNRDYVNQVFNCKILFNDPGYFLICDNPIIKKSEAKNSDLLDEFIVPLSKECILINNKVLLPKKIPDELFIQMGIAILDQANRFICGHDELFLEKIVEHYKVYEKFNKTDIIIPELFEMIKNIEE